MSNKDADKEKSKKPAAKAEAPAKEKKPKEAKVEAEPVAEKKVEAPRQPADPRLKYVKKFHGKFLPRGPLRDRHTALFARWNSGEDRGGVTVEELKSLHADWMVSRQKGPKKAATA
ncbi:hypothetical protein [Paludisphaera rhizosphaerae]|uniref:hypothetical protein n=1 Tax=Paludisphaera rhizosphaerae TaxID=2711216 RepID=UPI0013EDE8FB|nr:hypothetical protein [Paludisphaera rhizosphaerae]